MFLIFEAQGVNAIILVSFKNGFIYFFIYKFYIYIYNIYSSNKLLICERHNYRDSVYKGYLCILVNCARETKEKFVEWMDD